MAITLTVNGSTVGTYSSEQDAVQAFANMAQTGVARLVYCNGARKALKAGFDRDWRWCAWTSDGRTVAIEVA